eukprot:TRINITY_DN13506_c0_g3_i1.p1 TRINITY_DN13506_c0_g3~~TRINITY_DN13506_c0_g3_i1.p1  ORF type:complete len:190 (+),score=33.08 TRINITY_DN13506_c0_g3_i1:77-646(+)
MRKLGRSQAGDETDVLRNNIPKLALGYIWHNWNNVVNEYVHATGTNRQSAELLMDKCKGKFGPAVPTRTLTFFRSLPPSMIELLKPILRKIHDRPKQYFRRMNFPDNSPKIHMIQSIIRKIIDKMGGDYKTKKKVEARKSIRPAAKDVCTDVKAPKKRIKPEFIIENVLDFSINTWANGSSKVELKMIE